MTPSKHLCGLVWHIARCSWESRAVKDLKDQSWWMDFPANGRMDCPRPSSLETRDAAPDAIDAVPSFEHTSKEQYRELQRVMPVLQSSVEDR